MRLSARSKVFLSIAGVCLGLAVLVLAALWHLNRTYWKVARITGDPIPVQVDRVKVGTVQEALASEGGAKEFEIVPLSALVAGTVARINVRIGDVVQKGQRLVELNPVPLQSVLRMAETRTAEEKSQLAILTEKVTVMKDLFAKEFVSRDDLNNALLAKSNSEQNLAQRQNEVVQAKVNLASALVDSPVGGIVTVRDVYVGSTVKEQSPILTVAQIDPILVQIPYAESRIRELRLGQPAQLSFYAFPGEKFGGVVSWIDPTVDTKTRLMTVQVKIPNQDLRLKPGMRGIAWLDNARAAVLRVPGIALLSTFENTAYVFVVDDKDTAHTRKITIGAYAEGYFEVRSGLNPDERVVVVGQVGLKDKDKVRIYDK